MIRWSLAVLMLAPAMTLAEDAAPRIGNADAPVASPALPEMTSGPGLLPPDLVLPGIGPRGDRIGEVGAAEDLFRSALQARIDRLADLDRDMRAADAEVAAILDRLTSEPDPAKQRELKDAFDAASADLKSMIALFDAEIARLDEIQLKDQRP